MVLHRHTRLDLVSTGGHSSAGGHPCPCQRGPAPSHSPLLPQTGRRGGVWGGPAASPSAPCPPAVVTPPLPPEDLPSRGRPLPLSGQLTAMSVCLSVCPLLTPGPRTLDTPERVEPTEEQVGGQHCVVPGGNSVGGALVPTSKLRSRTRAPGPGSDTVIPISSWCLTTHFTKQNTPEPALCSHVEQGQVPQDTRASPKGPGACTARPPAL